MRVWSRDVQVGRQAVRVVELEAFDLPPCSQLPKPPKNIHVAPRHAPFPHHRHRRLEHSPR